MVSEIENQVTHKDNGPNKRILIIIISYDVNNVAERQHTIKTVNVIRYAKTDELLLLGICSTGNCGLNTVRYSQNRGSVLNQEARYKSFSSEIISQ